MQLSSVDCVSRRRFESENVATVDTDQIGAMGWAVDARRCKLGVTTFAASCDDQSSRQRPPFVDGLRHVDTMILDNAQPPL